MKATFVELSPFSKYREDYVSDDEYRALQQALSPTRKLAMSSRELVDYERSGSATNAAVKESAVVYE